MSMTKTLIASVLAVVSASAAFAGGLNDVAVEEPPIVQKEDPSSSFSGPSSYGSAGGVALAVGAIALVAALASDSDGSSTTTTD